MRTVTILGTAIFVAASVPVPASAQPRPVFVGVETPTPSPLPPGVLRERLVNIAVDELERARLGSAGRSGLVEQPTLWLNLFDDTQFVSVVEQTAPTSEGYSLSGSLVGTAGSMTFVVNGDLVVGSVHAAEGRFQIRQVGDDLHVVRQLAPVPRLEHDVLRPSRPAAPESDRVRPIRPPDLPPGPGAAPPPREDGLRLDVLVVYTPRVRAKHGGHRGLRAQIDLMIAETNQAYAASGVGTRLHLAHAAEVAYRKTKGEKDLRRLQDPRDGHLDVVHNLRNRFAADVVTLLVPAGFNRNDGFTYDSCGIAYQTWAIAEDAPWAFNVVADHCGGLTLAHEVGHNQGLGHDRYVLDERRSILPFPYSAGYVNQRMFIRGAPPSSRWVTIMAYHEQCDDWREDHGLEWEEFHCTSILRFSNPGRRFKGDPTGIRGSRPSAAVDGPADARRSLNNRLGVLANFRRAPCLRHGLKVRLQASTGEYVVAVGNGGGDVHAAGSRPGPRGLFTLVDHNGGCLVSGDRVSLHTSDQFYLRARRGGGARLDATAPRATSWARFVIGRHRGSGALRYADVVTLQTQTGHYVWAEQGGGSGVRADRVQPGVWGRFTIVR